MKTFAVGMPRYDDAIPIAINPPVPSVPSVSARLTQIEATARKEQYVHSATVLWLVQELRKSMSQLMVIDSEVRRICDGIDSVLEKAIAP